MSGLTNYSQYSDPLLITWRKGTEEDPYVEKSESWEIIRNKIALDEIPDKFNHVTIAGYTEVDADDVVIPNANQFIVNYQNGIVTFNQSENGKTVAVTYMAKGIILYPASRIYIHGDDPDIISSLQDLVENVDDVIAAVGDLDAALEDAHDTADDLRGLSATGEALNTQLQTSITTATTKKSDLDASIGTANTTKTALDQSNTVANTTKSNLDTSISSGNTTKINLDASNTAAGNTKTALDETNTTATELKTDLDSRIATATTKKTELDGSISSATSKKSELDASITASETAKTNLDGSITTATNKKTDLDGSIALAATSKTDLDGTISSAELLKSQLEADITIGNTLKGDLEDAIVEGNTLIVTATDINDTLNGSVELGTNKIQEIDDMLDVAEDAVSHVSTAVTNANDVAARMNVFETYNNTKVYYPLNKVSYGGSSYVCLLQTTAGTLPSNPVYWALIAQAGSGNVSSVNGDATGDFIVQNPTSNVVISLNTGLGANNIVKLDSSGYVTADILKNGSTNVVVTTAQVTAWNGKQDALGFIPESIAKKGIANGYAPLDVNGLVPVQFLPIKPSMHVVTDTSERLALTGLSSGEMSFEISTGDTYIWDGTAWRIQSDADWANVSLDWANITNKPTSTVLQIDTAVSVSHSHTNKAILDATTASFTTVFETKLTGIASGATLVAASGTNGNIKINNVETLVYAHPAGDGNLHVPANDTTNNLKVLKSGASAGSIGWGFVDWGEITGKQFVVSATEPINPPTNMIWFDVS